MNHFKILEEESSDDWLVLDGPLFLFGGEDLTGEHFTENTNSDSEYTKTIGRLPIDAEHGLRFSEDYPGRDEVLGYVEAATIRDDKYGRLARHLLNRRNQYVEHVFEPLARAKLIGSSSEAAIDGIVKTKNGEIVKWPLKRQSLTVTPAEKRLLSEYQLQVIKSIVAEYPQFKSFFADGQEAIEETAEAVGDIVEINNEMETKTMSEMNPDTPKIDFDGYQKSVGDRFDKLEGTLEKVVGALEKIPAKAAAIVVEDEADKALKAYPYKFGLMLQAVRNQATNAPMNDAHKAILGANEQVPSEGGYLVGTEQETTIEKKMHDSAVFASRANNRTIGNGANSVDFYGRKENSRASGSRYGGIVGYRVAEGGTITPSQMDWYKYTLKPEKYAVLAYATDEVAGDAALLESEILDAAPQELGFMLDDDMLNGTAAGYPKGILGASCLVTVAKESGQAAATVVAENIIKMWSRMYARSRANAVWFINQDVEPQLHQLALPVGTGGALVYMPPGGLSASPYGSLFGRPVVPTEFNATLGTVGDLVLADWSQYKLANKGGVQAASSMHVQFVTDQMAWRFTVRYDGQATWQAPLTPFKGTNTQSPFVALATRA